LNTHSIPAGNLEYSPRKGHHWVLVNKVTKKVASSSNWLVALAAVAVSNNDIVGIASLLPISKAKKLLKTNLLSLKRQRGIIVEKEFQVERDQANQLIPALAVIYGTQHLAHRPPRRNEFCKWVVRELGNKESWSYKVAVDRNHHEVLKKAKHWRWWLDRLGKMQS